jgi:hypothetical protein
MEEDSEASYVVECIGQYDSSHEDKLSIELQGLVHISEEHGDSCLEANIKEMKKKVQRVVVMDLLTLAVPSTEEQQRLTYDINTSNALFVYMLEKYARIKEEGIPTRVFKMTTDWKRIFQATQGTQGCRSTTTPSKPLTFNGSFVFLQNFRNFVEYDKAPLIYQVIKETISHYRRTESKKSRKELEKQNKRKFEDFCCSQLAQESVQDREMIQCVLKLDGEDRATSVAEMCKHLNYLGRDHMVGLGFILSSNLNSSLMQILLIGKTTRKDSANEYSFF